MFRFLLESVQHINGLGQLDGLDRTECIAIVKRDNFQYASCNVFQRLGVDVLIAYLCLIESKSNVPLYRLWEFGQRVV